MRISDWSSDVCSSDLHLAPSPKGSAANPAYVASMVSVSPTPAWNVFRGGEWRSMYVRAEASGTGPGRLNTNPERSSTDYRDDHLKTRRHVLGRSAGGGGSARKNIPYT